MGNIIPTIWRVCNVYDFDVGWTTSISLIIEAAEIDGANEFGNSFGI